jgi:hypothetical protein
MAQPLVRLAAATVKPCFTVTQSDAGDWIARDRRAGIERHFASQKAALHFALFQFGDCAATALLAPRV